MKFVYPIMKSSMNRGFPLPSDDEPERLLVPADEPNQPPQLQDKDDLALLTLNPQLKVRLLPCLA